MCEYSNCNHTALTSQWLFHKIIQDGSIICAATIRIHKFRYLLFWKSYLLQRNSNIYQISYKNGFNVETLRPKAYFREWAYKQNCLKPSLAGAWSFWTVRWGVVSLGQETHTHKERGKGGIKKAKIDFFVAETQVFQNNRHSWKSKQNHKLKKKMHKFELKMHKFEPTNKVADIKAVHKWVSSLASKTATPDRCALHVTVFVIPIFWASWLKIRKYILMIERQESSWLDVCSFV